MIMQAFYCCRSRLRRRTLSMIWLYLLVSRLPWRDGARLPESPPTRKIRFSSRRVRRRREQTWVYLRSPIKVRSFSCQKCFYLSMGIAEWQIVGTGSIVTHLVIQKSHLLDQWFASMIVLYVFMLLDIFTKSKPRVILITDETAPPSPKVPTKSPEPTAPADTPKESDDKFDEVGHSTNFRCTTPAMTCRLLCTRWLIAQA